MGGGRRRAAAIPALCAAAGLCFWPAVGGRAFAAAPRIGRSLWASVSPFQAATGRRRSAVTRLAHEEAAAQEDSWLRQLRGLAAQGNVDKAEDTLFEMVDDGADATAAHYAAVITACAPTGDFKRAQRWFFRMQALEVAPDLATFNALLSVAAEAEDTSEAPLIIQGIEEFGLKPNLESFKLAMRAFQKAGDVTSVEPWLERIYDAGITPDAACMGMVVGTFAEQGLIDKAEEWLAIMQRTFPGEVEASSYNHALRAYASQGKMEKAEDLFDRMEASGARPDDVSFVTVIGDGTEPRDPEKLKLWCERMLESGVEISQEAYVAVIGAWSAVGDLPQVDEWFGRMADEGKQNTDALALVVDTMMLAGGPDNEEAAQEWISQFREAGLPLTPSVYAGLVSRDVYDGDFEQVEAKMHQMEADGLEMDDASLSALLQAYANAEPQQSSLAEQAFKQFMLQGKIRATRPLLESLRSAVGGARCLALRRELRLAGPSGTPVSLQPEIFQGREQQIGLGKLVRPGDALHDSTNSAEAQQQQKVKFLPSNYKSGARKGRRWRELMEDSKKPELIWE